MGQQRSIVITGYGATTPLGGTAASTWQAAIKGVSAADTLDAEWVEELGLPVHFAAEIYSDPSETLAKHEMKKLDRSGQFAVIAAREAWAQAGDVDADPERVGCIVSTGIGGIWTLLSAYDTLKEKGPRRIHPMTVPMLMPNGAAGAVALEIGAQAGAHCTASACASGAESVAAAITMIRSGAADVVLAGGTEAAIHPLPMGGFSAMHALSKNNDDPASASRPFCPDRNGFVLGEGAACLVMEEESHAIARGATILGRVLGAGITSDAHHIAAPEPNGAGAKRAVERALEDAGVTANDVVHVNAHATSTPAGDVAEAKALRSALGSAMDNCLVTATKSMTGHLLGGAGALESVLTVQALAEGICPPTINTRELDEGVDINVPLGEAASFTGDVAINNSFGFGGHNVALVFGKA